MRLTCPNCSARYEVDDSMVPPEGRDVQCSNCTTTWFQPGRRVDVQPTAVHVARGALDDEPAPETQPNPRPTRREIDPGVRDILREEAEREARLRRGESDPVETQAEMPLEEEADAANRARRRAELDEAQDAFDADADHGGSRRDLLPDIEEINSTLRATGDRSPEEEDASDIETLETAPARRRGVRSGFLLVLIFSIAGVLLYSNVDAVAEVVPQAEPVLRRFEDLVNNGRFWLDDMARNLVSNTEG